MKNIKIQLLTLLFSIFCITITLTSSATDIVVAKGYIKYKLPVVISGPVDPIYNPMAIISNPFNNSSNYLSNILKLSDKADGTSIFFFDMTNQNYELSTFYGGYGWYPDYLVNPGEAFFIQPFSSDNTDLDIVFKGNIPQGTFTNQLPVYPGCAFKSSITPLSLCLGNEYTPYTLGFPAEDGDTIYLWDFRLQEYIIYSYYEGYGWAGVVDNMQRGPVISIGSGFFIQKSPNALKYEWIQKYNIDPYFQE